MSNVEKSIEVNVPLKTAYNQWTQFESFPQFMKGVKEVKQLDDRQLHWRAEIGGKEVQWDAEIIEQIPDRRIAWVSTTGAKNAGSVDFSQTSEGCAKVTLHMEYDPEGVTENIGSAISIPESQIEGDLKRFKKFIEAMPSETGAWRGEIKGGHKMKM